MEKERAMGIQLTFELSTKFPGFKFSPSDEELITYYLKKKLEGYDDRVSVIPFVEINKFDPWDLPAKSAIYSECEWFYFSPRERKYRNGSQNKRATESGYWKATGKERKVKSGSTVIGTKRTLVFHAGRAPKAERTQWIMHEFCTLDQSESDLFDSSLVICRLRKNSEFRLGESRRKSVRKRESNENNSSSGNGEGTMNVDGPKDSSSNSYTSNSVDQGHDNVESDFGKKHGEGPSSPRKKNNDDEEDFYADILNDKLVDLDETLMPPYPNSLLLTPYAPESQRIAQNPIEAFQFNAPSVQTGATRGMKITPLVEQLNVKSRKELGGNGQTSTGMTVSQKKKQRKRTQKKAPSCIVNLFQDKSIRYRYAYISCVFIFGFLFLFWLVDHFMFPIPFKMVDLPGKLCQMCC